MRTYLLSTLIHWIKAVGDKDSCSWLNDWIIRVWGLELVLSEEKPGYGGSWLSLQVAGGRLLKGWTL
jgi:hypothetical protein